MSRIVNAKQKASPTRVVKWDEGVNSHFEGKPVKKAAYQQKAQESAKRAQAYNQAQDYKRKVNEWEGEAGAIAKRYFESLIANGRTPELAFLEAEYIKKICDTLNSQQLTSVQEKINAMSVNTMDIPDFFEWKEGKYESKDANYQVHTKDIIYSDFSMFAQANRGNADAEALVGLIFTIASTAVSAYQVYQVYKAVSASINAYRTYNSYTSSVNNGNIDYDEWWSQVDAGYSPEQRYNLQKYGRIDGIDVGSYDDVLAYSQHNMNSNKVMLGKYDDGGATSYITKAGKEYSYFDVGGDWQGIMDRQGLTEKQMFDIYNKPFLDDAMQMGKTIHFSHDPTKDKNTLGNEFKYILNNGYKYYPEEMIAKPIK